jgi:hypothetical protein
MKNFQQFQESGGETVNGEFMSYATMRAKGIKPKQTAVQKTRKDIEDRHGKGAIYDPKNPPKSQSKPKPKTQKPLSAAEKAQKEVDARYGRTPWNKKGSLGT